jgi:hypothetical protein
MKTRLDRLKEYARILIRALDSNDPLKIERAKSRMRGFLDGLDAAESLIEHPLGDQA